MRKTSGRRRGLAAWLVVLGCIAGAVPAGCGSNRQRVGRGTVIGVTERDFQISTVTAPISAGDVVLRVHNEGPDQHELIVAPESRRGLPFRTDGFTVNEEAIQRSEPGAIEPQRPGGTEYLHVHLRPGRYVLFCNMSGHFMAGMHTDLVVH
jgi:uncharacterized cupredoxin-like copper-binding protein